MNVREVMTTRVRSLGPEDTLNSAIMMMRDQGDGCLLVVGESGMLVGILTDRDIALSAYELGEALWRLRVVDSMRKEVWTCHAEDDVQVAAKVMREHRVRRLPVVDTTGTPIGILSLDDLSRASRQSVLDLAPSPIISR